MLLTSCAVGWQARQAGNREAIGRLDPGMSKASVQQAMPEAPSFVESFTREGGDRVDVLFYYTNRKWGDGNDTRDETTPLVFVNNELVGWGDTFLQAVISGEATITVRDPSDEAALQPLNDGRFPTYDEDGSGLIRLAAPLEARSGLEGAKEATIVIEVADRQGSGFMVTPTGVALTNAHVVGEQRTFVATLASGTRVDGRVLRKSQAQDVAVVQVLCGNECVSLAVGTVADIQVGEDVFVVGSPLGLTQSVAKGIVSGLRRLDGSTWVQTDASVNRGNSGGPLIAASTGAAVGINTWGVRKDVAEGLNFALSIDEALATLGLVRSRQE